MPKPLRNDCGNGMHISFTVFPDSDFLEERGSECGDIVKSAAAGIMEHIREFTLLANSTVNSYARLGEFTAPRDIIWSDEEGSQLIRMSPDSEDTSVELRAADCVCDPYLVLGLMIYSALDGITAGTVLPEKNKGTESLPANIEAAADIAEKSEFLKKYIPGNILEVLIRRSREEWKEYSSAYDKEAFEDKKYFSSL
jgi:glutamine synthetase